jgi:hypothetical protein
LEHKHRIDSETQILGNEISSINLLLRPMSLHNQRDHRKLYPAQCIDQNGSDVCQYLNIFVFKSVKIYDQASYGQPKSEFSSSSLQFVDISSDPSRQSFLPLQSFIASIHAPYEHLKAYLGHRTFKQTSSSSSVRLKQSALPSQTSSSDMHVPLPQS